MTTSSIAAAMTGLWSTPTPPVPPSPNPDDHELPEPDLPDIGIPELIPLSTNNQATPSPRPPINRSQPQAPPPHQPPPPPSPQQQQQQQQQQIGNPTDSLSLLQLKRIVTEFPRVEPTAYAFTYDDTASFAEEIDEWFSYNEAEFVRLRTVRNTFTRRWQKRSLRTWGSAGAEERTQFMKAQLEDLGSEVLRRRCKGLHCLLYVVLGVWEETAAGASAMEKLTAKGKPRSVATLSQVLAMRTGVQLVAACGGVTAVYELMKTAFESFWADEALDGNEETAALMQDELDNVTTIFYILLEVTRNNKEHLTSVREQLVKLDPTPADYFLDTTAKLRWDDGNELPQTRIFLLFWKAVLLQFGGSTELQEVKDATSEIDPAKKDAADLITASPLDYHAFRQEITSKYPAYIPPAPLLPLELDNNSILPPLPNHPSRNNGSNGILPAPPNSNTGGGSILHQPVHIATPAPSPPPSPPVGGKAGKKQNYQTNQNFPFMYPPLDSTSNSAGGKGAAGLQEALVGRKWEGSDIPASILEAGDLFAKRTRMSRAMRQLWDEREKFLKFERGWEAKVENDQDVEEIDLAEEIFEKLNLDEKKSETKRSEGEPAKLQVDYGPWPINDTVKQRLDSIESFYSGSLPHLQSIVIVLMKAVLVNVTAAVAYPSSAQPQSALAPAFQSEVNLRANGLQNQRRPPPDPNFVPPQIPLDVSELSVEELENFRSREITAKAVSGILLILLKWFKVSHVLKFEYFNQLLLDSNYLPLVLKLFAHQDIDKLVDANSDRSELSFFNFCKLNRNKDPMFANATEMEFSDEDDEDDALPPPIKLHRDTTAIDTNLSAVSFQDGSRTPGKTSLPEIDELGFPGTEMPTEPKTEFSWRNFFWSINFLRVMQKINKHKAHRNLLLVQYKSSNILKKALKIPQHHLRLYTLKLFKNQVPYCGRKWRQGNMRIITSIYLHCKPELRDDWLAGSDVDAEVEEALPLEQALRALTHWRNVKVYPERMGVEVKIMEEERDFFARELEKMEGIVGLWDVEVDEGDSVWNEPVNGW